MTLEPPPDELRAFYEAERSAASPADADTQARILERVRLVAEIAAPVGAATEALTAAGAATTTAAATGVGLKTLVAVATISFAVGGVLGHVVTRAALGPPPAPQGTSAAEEDHEEVERVEPPATPPEAAEASAQPPAGDEPTSGEPTTTSGEPTTTTGQEPADSELPRQSLSRERRLLDSATAAIARANWSEAEAALARHGRIFPQGALVEEREALRVRVAFEAGRYEAAEALSQRFLLRFDGSLYAPRVRQLQRRAREMSHETTPSP